MGQYLIIKITHFSFKIFKFILCSLNFFCIKIFLLMFYGRNNLLNNSEDTNLIYLQISPVFSLISEVLFSLRSSDIGFLLIFKNKGLV